MILDLAELDESKVICLTDARARYEAKKCRHRRMIVDEEKAEVVCEACGEKLNAMAMLVRFAQEESRFEYRLKAMKEYGAQLDAKQRCKCQHCGKMTRVRA